MSSDHLAQEWLGLYYCSNYGTRNNYGVTCFNINNGPSGVTACHIQEHLNGYGLHGTGIVKTYLTRGYGECYT